MNSRLASLVSLGPILATVVSSAVQAQGKFERELEFVRRLATELRFISLAQAEAESLQRMINEKKEAMAAEKPKPSAPSPAPAPDKYVEKVEPPPEDTPQNVKDALKWFGAYSIGRVNIVKRYIEHLKA